MPTSSQGTADGELRLYLQFVQRWWWVLLLAGALAAVGGMLVGRGLPPTYAASATLVIGRALAQSQDLTTQEIEGRDVLAKNVAALATRQPLLEASAVAAGVPIDWRTFQERVTVTPQEGMQLLDITVEGSTPAEAEALANALATQLISISRRQVALFAAAQTQPDPIRPNVPMLTVLAGLLGLLATGAVLVLRQLTDGTLRSSADLTTHFGLSPLATIHARRRGQRPKPDAPVTEEYRRLRSALQPLLTANGIKTLLITSAGAGEGKSTVAANLAIALARAQYQTVLIDAHFAHPTLPHQLGIKANGHGLLQLLADHQAAANALLAHPALDHLRILPSGDRLECALELLGSLRMQQILHTLAGQADVVIIDGPPLLATADATTLASLLDGVIVVIRNGHTRRDTLQRALEHLHIVNANLLGGVLNRAKA